MPVREATQTLIAPMLQALHRHSIGACTSTGLEIDPAGLIDTQIGLMLHGLQPGSRPRARGPRKAAA